VQWCYFGPARQWLELLQLNLLDNQYSNSLSLPIRAPNSPWLRTPDLNCAKRKYLQNSNGTLRTHTINSECNKPAGWLCQQESSEDICQWCNVLQVVNHNNCWQMRQLGCQTTAYTTHHLRQVLLYITTVLSTCRKCHDISFYHTFTTTSKINKQAFVRKTQNATMSIYHLIWLATSMLWS